jgi:hypothetical protein
MKVNGYRIKNAIQSHCHQREVLENQFKKSLKKFPDEDKPKPTVIMQKYRVCEESIAHLQQLQTVYNNTVKVNFEGGTVPRGAPRKCGGRPHRNPTGTTMSRTSARTTPRTPWTK